MENQFSAGDVVYLKSGGPAMTIVSANELAGVECHWFHEGRRECAYFRPEVITKTNPDPRFGQVATPKEAARKGFKEAIEGG